MTDITTEPTLDEPYYGATPDVAVRRFFRKYATFHGRASRSEFWWWTVITFAIHTVLNSLALVTGGATMNADAAWGIGGGFGVVFVILSSLWGLATIVPQFALLARRLHDTNRSAGWIFFLLVPLVGVITILVFVLSAPKPEGARFDR